MRHNLSDITNLIKDRRTITPENYTDRKVQKEVIKDILTNASWAPTHGMTQPWRFKVFMGDTLTRLGEFTANLYKDLSDEDSFKEIKFNKIKNRPQMTSVVIAVCMKRDPRLKIREIEEVEAVACAVQNMYLTCTAYGLGSFWATPALIYSEQMNDFLGLDKEDKCLGLFYVGYPKIDWPKGYRKPLEHLVEWME